MLNEFMIEYNQTDYDDLFFEWYEIDGISKIKELSRQLRTFFNYKTEVIRLRFQTNFKPNESNPNTQFYSQKQKIELLTKDFVNLLKTIKEGDGSLEQAIQSLFFESNKKRLIFLSELTEKLSILIHQFSEASIHKYPKFLKFILVLAKNLSFVKKCLNIKFSEFYEELETNYCVLEKELGWMLENRPGVQINKVKKQYEEGLPS